MTAMRFSGVSIFAALASMSILGCGEKAQVAVPPPAEVIVSHPLKKEVTQYLEFTGTTAALEFVEIRARVEGWLESIHFTPGSQVKKGDLLFVIDPRPFQAQGRSERSSPERKTGRTTAEAGQSQDGPNSYFPRHPSANCNSTCRDAEEAVAARRLESARPIWRKQSSISRTHSLVLLRTGVSAATMWT